MEQIGREFSDYVHLACQYAALEYELGVNSPVVMFYLNKNMVEMLGACWMSCVSIPDAANMIATTIQFDSK